MLGIICASLVSFHLLPKHRMEEIASFPPPSQNCQYRTLFRVLQISIRHLPILSCILRFNSKWGRRDSAANHPEPYSTFRISMNVSHVPRSLRSTRQLHSSLFHISYPAARFPGVAALLYGNRRRRLPAQAIRFAENRLKHQTASDHTDSCCLL